MLRLPPFRYHVPRDLSEAVAVKGELGMRAVYVAGGTGLFPGMKRGQLEPEVVIPVHRLSDLRSLERSNGDFRVGAAMTLAELAGHPEIRSRWPVLAQAAGQVATPLVRNLATVGGNLCLDTRCSFFDQSREWREAIDFCLKKDGDLCRVARSSTRCWAVQSSDLSPVAIAMGARFELLGPGGPRHIEAEDFYNDDGMQYLRKDPDELVTGILFPRESGELAYVKVSRRVSFDFPVLAVAVWILRAAPGADVDRARIVLGAVGSAPMVVKKASAVLTGRPLDEAAIADAAEAAWEEVRPMDNADRSALWRKQVVRPYVTRALQRLASA